MGIVSLPVIPAFLGGRKALRQGNCSEFETPGLKKNNKTETAKIHTFLAFIFETPSLKTRFLQIILFDGHFW